MTTTRNRIYIETPIEDGRTEMLPYSPEDIDWMMDKEIIDTDQLGYAMTDCKAFDEALLKLTEMGGVMSFGKIVEMYLSMTDEDIVIRM